MAPAKNGGEEEKGHPAIKDAMTREYTNIPKHAHGKGFGKRVPGALKGFGNLP